MAEQSLLLATVRIYREITIHRAPLLSFDNVHPERFYNRAVTHLYTFCILYINVV